MSSLQRITDTGEQITGSNSCRRCAECCRWPGHVLLSADDLSALARHLGLGEDAFVQRYTRLASNRAQLSLGEQADGSCVFLEGRDCRVYEARPAQCRLFPAGWTVPGGCAGTRGAR